MGSGCLKHVDVDVTYGFGEYKGPAGDRIMAYLMISRVYNARWRSHSNRESGCMKEGVEGSEIDTERTRTQKAVRERHNGELLIVQTQ